MKISDKIPPIKIEAYTHQTQEKNTANGSPAELHPRALREDKVELSQTAREVKRIREELDSIPDIREEKIEEIKNQINNGTYKIDGKKIAFNMLRESLIDEKV